MPQEEKSKGGRPRKVAPPETNEKDEVLTMTQKEAPEGYIAIKDVQQSLTALYAQALGVSAGWTEAMDTLQRNNPFLQNQRLKSISDIPGVMSGEQLAKALSAPQNSEIGLRRQGWALSSSQYLYYKILRMYADVPLYKYYKTPDLLNNVGDYKSKDFVEEDRFVDEWLAKFDLPNTLKRVAFETKREGKSVYVLRNSLNEQKGKPRHVNYCTWQKLPTNYVKLTGIGEHGYIASFNMMLFLNPAFSPLQYPDFIRKIWEDMLEVGVVTKAMLDNGKMKARSSLKNYSISQSGKIEYSTPDDGRFESDYMVNDSQLIKFSSSVGGNVEIAAMHSYAYWVELPQDLCYVFATDTSNAWAVPDTIALFTELQNLSDFDTLSGLIASTPLTAMLTAEVPMIADANLNAGADQTALSPDTILGYQNKFNNSTSSNIDAYIAPFKNMKLQSLPNVPNSSDISTKATQNFISKSGMGGLISTTDKPSVAAIKAAQMLYEAECDFLTRQFESVLNMIIDRHIGTKYTWKLHIWGGIYTFDSEVKRDKELFVAGASFVLPKLASAYNLSLRDVKSADIYIQSLDLYKYFKTVTQATQERLNSEDGKEKKSGAGRPEVDENEIDNDNTAASKDGGADTADMRDFAAHRVEEGKCIICGEDSDDPICEDCCENIGAERKEE